MLKALRDEVFVEVEEESNRHGLIVIGSKSSGKVGTVRSVGSGWINHKGVREEIPLKEGDKVFFPNGTGLLIDHDDRKLIMLKFSDVLGIIKEDDKT